MAYSSDADLLDFIPDILNLGIDSFLDEHPKAEADIQRELRIKWWPKKRLLYSDYDSYLEMDNSKLTESQFVTVATYLVLWRYALPQLTNWVDGDRFSNMIEFYKARYSEELENILADGVEYDDNDDGIVQDSEKQSVGQRLDR